MATNAQVFITGGYMNLEFKGMACVKDAYF